MPVDPSQFFAPAVPVTAPEVAKPPVGSPPVKTTKGVSPDQFFGPDPFAMTTGENIKTTLLETFLPAAQVAGMVAAVPGMALGQIANWAEQLGGIVRSPFTGETRKSILERAQATGERITSMLDPMAVVLGIAGIKPDTQVDAAMKKLTTLMRSYGEKVESQYKYPDGTPILKTEDVENTLNTLMAAAGAKGGHVAVKQALAPKAPPVRAVKPETWGPEGKPSEVSQAAFRDPDGNIVPQGQKHSELLKQDSKLEQGFITADGEFLDRKAAETRAREVGQLTPEDPMFRKEEGLHSGDIFRKGEVRGVETPAEPTTADLVRKQRMEAGAEPTWSDAIRAAKKPAFERDASDLRALKSFQMTGAKIAGVAGLAAATPFLQEHLDQDQLGLIGLGGAALAMRVKGGIIHPDAIAGLSDSLVSRLPPETVPVVKDWSIKSVGDYLRDEAGTAEDRLKGVSIPTDRGPVRWEDLTNKAIGPASIPKILEMRRAGKAEIGESIWDISAKSSPVEHAALSTYVSHVGEFLKNTVPLADLPNWDFVRAVKATAEQDKRTGFRLERGAVDAELLRRGATLATGGFIGASVGAALVQPDDKLAGALLGASIGLGLGTVAGRSFAQRSATFRNIERGVKTSIEQFMKAVNPDLLGEEARNTASVLGSNMVRMMRQELVRGVEGSENRAFWNKQPPLVDKQFLKGIEQGKTDFGDPKLNELATQFRERTDTTYRADEAAKIEYEPIENYVYHLFEDPLGASAWLTKRYGTQWGDPKFTKERSARMLEQAEAAGFRLKTTNPEELLQMREHASDMAHMKVQALRELEEYGIARRIAKGEKIEPGETLWRSPNGELFALGDQANTVFHNAFETKSLWADPGAAGMTYRGAMYAKNTIVPFRLVSLFHPIHVLAGMSWADAMTVAGKRLAAGKTSLAGYLMEGVKDFTFTQALKDASVTAVPKWFGGKQLRATYDTGLDQWSGSARYGWRIMQALEGKIPEAELAPHERQSLLLMQDGAFHPTMALEYRNQHIRDFQQAINDVRTGRSIPGGVLRTTWNFPFAVMEKFYTRPIFERWIPAMKTASYLRNAYTALEANPELLGDRMARMNALRKLSKMTDDRFGEMQYKTVFMNRLVKDAAVGGMLSYGWQVGFIRSGIGAVPELGKATLKALETGDVKSRITKGELDKAAFAMYYTMGTMLYGGLLTYAMTGKPPTELLDYIFPKTGDTNPDGSDARVSTPFYTREAVSIPKHIEEQGFWKGLGTTVANKMSPAVSSVKALVTNRDFFNREISDPNASTLEVLGQQFKYVMGDLEPMAISAEERGVVTPKQRTLNWMGFTPAPKYVTEGPAETLIKSAFSRYHTSVTPFEKAAYSKDAAQLRQFHLAGDQEKYTEKLSEMQEKYGLRGADIARMRKSSRIPSDVKMFQALSATQQTQVLQKMDEESRDKYLRYSHKTVRGKLSAAGYEKQRIVGGQIPDGRTLVQRKEYVQRKASEQSGAELGAMVDQDIENEARSILETQGRPAMLRFLGEVERREQSRMLRQRRRKKSVEM